MMLESVFVPKMSMFLLLLFCERKNENSSYSAALTGKTPCSSLGRTSVLQLTEILAGGKGRRVCSSSVAVCIIMVWQNQLKSVNSRSIISEIIDEQENI